MFQLLLVIIYISFISLGLPDSLLGSAWPSIYREWNVPISYAGIISMIIAFGTIISSLQSDRLTRRLGTGKVTAISVGMTAAALFGFSVSTSFWMLCLWAVPYGWEREALTPPEQLCGSSLQKPSYELAPLYVGTWRHCRTVYHELRSDRRDGWTGGYGSSLFCRSS